jgi:predicted DsbA family dithiol-disulfide isomerase
MAHSLIKLAHAHGGAELEAKARDRVFDAIYESGLNVSDLGVLVAIAKDLGISDAEEALASGQYTGDVLRKDKAAKTVSPFGCGYLVFCLRGL